MNCKIRRTVTVLCILLTLCLLCMSLGGCAGATGDDAPIDAGSVSFSPTVYYARGGRVRFLYDAERDMLTALEGYDMASLYDGGTYSMFISYEEGTLDRKTADAQVLAEFGAGAALSAGKDTEGVTVSGYPFRSLTIEGEGQVDGAVYYGNTGTGFAKIYYILAPDASEDDVQHVEEIVSTLRFSEFTGEDLDQSYTNIYYQ